MLFKLSNLNSNLALILGYLNPALNNSAQVVKRHLPSVRAYADDTQLYLAFKPH